MIAKHYSAWISALWAVGIATSHFEAVAQTETDRTSRCATWIEKKGYSRDYIEKQTGFRPPPRNKWRDNIRREDLQVGDVVGVNLWPGHVALVEEIERDEKSAPLRLKVSSFNYGGGKGWIDKGCDVTVAFGIKHTFWASMPETIGYWRPGLDGKRTEK